MIYVCQVNSHKWGRTHQAYVRGQQAVQYYNWEHHEDYVAGETNLGRVRVMTYAFPLDASTNALHKEHNVLWTYGTVRLFKEIQSPSYVNPMIKVVKTIFLEVDMEPEYKCTGFGAMGLPLLEPRTAIVAGVPTTAIEQACMLRMDSVTSYSPDTPTRTPNDGPHPGKPYPPAVSISAKHKQKKERTLQQYANQLQGLQEVRDVGPAATDPSDEIPSASRSGNPPRETPAIPTRRQQMGTLSPSQKGHVSGSKNENETSSPFQSERMSTTSCEESEGRESQTTSSSTSTTEMGENTGIVGASTDSIRSSQPPQTPPVTRSQTEKKYSRTKPSQEQEITAIITETTADGEDNSNQHQPFNPLDQSIIGVSMLPNIEQIQKERAERAARREEEDKFFESTEIKIDTVDITVKTEPEVPELPFQNDPVPSSSSEPQVKQEDVSVTEVNISETDRDQGEPEETGGEASGGTEL